MFLHYLTIAIRNLLKNKTQSIISIIGLAVGFVCISLSAIWIRYETTYDKSHPNAENIYRIIQTYKKTEDGIMATIVGSAAMKVRETYTEIESSTIISDWQEVSLIKQDGTTVNCHGADSKFFDVFSIQFIVGNKENALIHPSSVVLNESTAKTLFGSAEQAMGKTIEAKISSLNNNDEKPYYTVTGVIKDIKHSILYLDTLVPFTKWETEQMHERTMNIYSYYVLLKKNINKTEFFNKLSNDGDESAYYTAVPVSQLRYKYDVYGNSQVLPIKHHYMVILLIISALLFLCALLNHITLFISFTYTRFKNLGLRKAIGSSTKQLATLLITEFLLTILLAMLLGVCIIEIVRPMLERIAHIEIELGNMFKYILMFAILELVLAVVFISVPILRMCRIAVKQNITSKKPMRQQTRKMLIVIQLIIGIFFLFITSVMYYQLHFIHTKDLGMNIKNVVIISPDYFRTDLDEFGNKVNIITSDLFGYGNIIEDVIIQSSDFFYESWNHITAIDWDGKDTDEKIDGAMLWLGLRFPEFFDVEIKSGRYFSDDISNEKGKVLINEKLAKLIGGDPIGKMVKTFKGEFEIIGVIEDIQDRSLKYESRPAVVEQIKGGGIYIRHHPNKASEAIKSIDDVFKKHGLSYNAEFMEDKFKSFTKDDTIMMQIISIVALACLLISIFGIYSLTLYSMEHRRREVAIRKVMGADVSNIIRMFFKEYIGLVIIASVIAIPPAYYIMNKWLQDYANRISIAYWLIAIIILFVLLIVIITVLRQIVKAANSNPADVIKYE